MILLCVWLLLVFLLGACVGSFLNVCVVRIPHYEKSILWPGSHCFHCYQPIRWYDNLPLVSYWLLRGRCRTCKAPYSIRYFLTELGTGLAFAGLFYLEAHHNVHRFGSQAGFDAFQIQFGLIPPAAWVVWGYHSILLSFLIVVSLSDIDHLEIPMSVTVTGMIVGLIGSVLFPWPWPWPIEQPNLLWKTVAYGPTLSGWGVKTPVTGLYPWPVWDELPAWMPHGSRLAGLATGLAGLLAGLLPRVVGTVYKLGRGQEGMGLGDADLMMMVGCFLGWQPVVVAFVAALAPGIVFGILQLVLRGDKPFPFGPSLAIGTLFTILSWTEMAPWLAQYLFNGPLLLGIGGAGAVFLFLASAFLRVTRGPIDDEPPPGDSNAKAEPASPAAPPSSQP